MAVIFNVKEEHSIVGLQVNLEVVKRVTLTSFNDRFHPFNELLYDRVFTTLLKHLDKIAKVKYDLLRKIFFHFQPLCLFRLHL